MKGQNFGWFRHVVMHGSTTSKLHSFHTRNSEHQNKLHPKARVLCSSASLASMDEIDQSHQTRTIHLPIDPNNKRPGSSEDEKICCSTSMDMHTIDTSHLKCPPVSNNNTKGVYGKFWERICTHCILYLVNSYIPSSWPRNQLEDLLQAMQWRGRYHMLCYYRCWLANPWSLVLLHEEPYLLL